MKPFANGLIFGGLLSFSAASLALGDDSPSFAVVNNWKATAHFTKHKCDYLAPPMTVNVGTSAKMILRSKPSDGVCEGMKYTNDASTSICIFDFKSDKYSIKSEISVASGDCKSDGYTLTLGKNS